MIFKDRKELADKYREWVKHPIDNNQTMILDCAESVITFLDINGYLNEFVRCKDCKWHGYLTCSNPEGVKGWVTDNDFCSYVERKGNFELPNIEELIS